MSSSTENNDTTTPAWRIIWAIWIVLTLSIASGIYFQSWSSVLIAVLTLVITLLPVLLPKHWGIHAPNGFIAAIVVFTFCTIYLGEYANFYERFWWWDVVLHGGSAFGMGLLGVTLMLILQKKDRIRARPFLLSVFAFSFAVALGAVWEVFEFTVDAIFKTKMQKSGLVDTMWDLIVDCIGALFSSIVGFIYLKKKAARETLVGVEELLDEAIEENVN